MKSFVIIGTDTDCGKTYVTRELVRYFQSRHRKVLALKPVASGCDKKDGQLISADALQLLSLQQNMTLGDICPWPMTLPVSPHLAAPVDNIHLSAKEIVEFCVDHLSREHDYLFIEAAGGLMVPLNQHETWVDVLKQSQIPVILVVGMRLGCINHALLTMSALDKYGIECAGWIANCIDKDMLLLSENIQTLTQKINQPPLTVIGFSSGIEDLSI